eukprot:CAMPEP_0170541316 /NCGR_PEP_ID=MMETSP0211-20121228/1076_1 /TAXON_ID=311385 /ORGANISM="Pseudokeronopsis sp., Strain OXSARD2" /LENGTH=64 /DNA_ID=CAMNT_0010843991 /DNA_START=315 /DNA_END=509 /DNA_ORIENTATION=-
MTEDTILEKVIDGKKDTLKYCSEGGNNSGAVYHGDAKYLDFISEVMRHQILSNPLHEAEFKMTG